MERNIHLTIMYLNTRTLFMQYALPNKDRYAALRHGSLKAFTLSKVQKLDCPGLGDKKPSQLLQSTVKLLPIKERTEPGLMFMDLFLLDHRQRLPLVDLAKKANSGSRSPLFRHLSELEARKPGPLTLPSKVSKPPHAVTNTNDTEAQRLESYGLVMNHAKCLFGVLVPQHLPTGSVPCPANVDFMASEAR